jgi:nucleoside-diphosphate-sugar epimerase
MNKFTLVGLITGALSLSAIVSFHPSSRYLQHFQRYQHHPDELMLLEQIPESSSRSNSTDDNTSWELRARQRRKRTRPVMKKGDTLATSAVVSNNTTRLYDLLVPLLHDASQTNILVAPPDTNWKTTNNDQSADSSKSICGINSKAAAEKYPHLYHSSSSDDQFLTSKSRVIITNVLSSVGMHLALELAQTCGVENILGIDAMLPNTRRHRMVQAMERYALLKRRIPGFMRLLVPYTGIWPKVEAEQLRLSVTFRPTHIVHLESDYESQMKDDDAIMNPLYPAHDKRLGMEQWLDFIRTTTTTNSQQPPHFVYAGTTNNLDDEHLLASTYQELYFQNQQVTMVSMELPRHIYGPWGEHHSWAYTRAQDVVLFRKNVTSYAGEELESTQVFCYVEDVVAAMITAMQLVTTTTVTLTSDTTKVSLEEALSYLTAAPGTVKKPKSGNPKVHLNELLQWSPLTRPVLGMQRLLSWHYTHVAHPYGTSKQKKLPPYVVQNYHYQFPCLSECSNPGNCRSSVFDGAVQTASKKATKGCKFVLYMANFSTAVHQLPPAVTPATNETICQVAFISDASALMLSQRQNNNSTTKRKQQYLEYRGWSLLPISEARMTEAEYMLPKISPGLLFDRAVSKALYVEMKTSLLLPHDGDNLLGLVYSIDLAPRQAKEKRVVRPGTSIVTMEWVPETPAKLVMMFGQEDSYLNNPEETTTMSLSQKVEHLWNHRQQEPVEDGRAKAASSVLLPYQHQLQFYEHASHLVQHAEHRSMHHRRSSPYGNAIPLWFWHSDFLVHDLRLEESRLLRCEWYDEYVFWQSRGMEDLSLAYVLAKRRIAGRHGPRESNDWTPLLHPMKKEPTRIPLDPEEDEEGSVSQRRVLSPRGNHLFMRVLRKPLDVLMAESMAGVA